MTAWFLAYVLSFSLTGEPEAGLLIENYKDQLTCEAKKFTAIGQAFYPQLVCMERSVNAI